MRNTQDERLFVASKYDDPKGPSNREKVQTLEDRRTRLIKSLKRLLRDAEGTVCDE